MANHKSAEKALRQNIKRNAINKSRTSKIRTFIKKLEGFISGGDQKTSVEFFKETQAQIMKGVTKGVLKKNTASRKVSRLFARVKAISS